MKYIEKVEKINIEYNFGTLCSLQCRRSFDSFERASDHILISSFRPPTVEGWGEENIAKRVGVRQKNCGAGRAPLPPSLSLVTVISTVTIS